MQCCQQPSLPIDQGSVAIESEDIELAEVEHGHDHFRMAVGPQCKAPVLAGSLRTGAILCAQLLLQFQRFRKFECDIGLRRQDDIFVSCERRATRSRTTASRHADCSTFAASGDCPDDATESSAATSQNSGSFSFAFRCKAPSGGLNRYIRAANTNGIQADLQNCSTLELAQRLCIGDGATDICALRN